MPLNDNQPPRSSIAQGDYPSNPPAEFVELGLVSCFSFLHGASDAPALLATAWSQGHHALGIADINTMAGVVRHRKEARTVNVKPLIGCRIVLVTGEAFLAYPTDRAAYGRLCALLTKGKMATIEGDWQDKGACHLSLDDLALHAEGVQLIALPGEDLEAFEASLPRSTATLPTLRHIAVSYLYRGDDRARINRLDRMEQVYGLGILATNDVHYHAPDRRPLQDVMTCIRHKTTVAQAGFLLHANAERHLKSPAEMIRLFAQWPNAIRATREVADACGFDLGELKYEYPDETVPQGKTADDYLSELTWAGAAERYPAGVSQKVRAVLDKELTLIAKLEISPYFLTIHDIVTYARSIGILCQGRGSAANSAVCYCLGITSVDPDQHDVLFERFISEERKEPPDIDVDFEHERREEVIQHIYAKYGRTRAGLCATIIHYRPRMAIREVGKVMGLSEDITSALAKTIWGSFGKDIGEREAAQAGLNLRDPHLSRTIKLAEQLIGMPRHLGQHVGGFILTQTKLSETVPIGNGAMPERSFIEWDKDDIEELGIFKVDVLALGMLTCIRKAFDLIDAHYGQRWTLATVPQEDQAVYDMLCRGDSLGVFQVESRAQMNMLPRLRPRTFYDLVIEVALVRPGPIQGDMVHPYLRRRSGREAVVYPSPAPEHGPHDELERILKRTLGVPIFQEQAMKLAMIAARFSPAEANKLRKAMATFRSRGQVSAHKQTMVERMVERGYDPVFAERCFSQIEGFGEYGFPESHAASFAHLVYISSWIKHHYPDVFCAALLNSQPMGFYAPAQIVRDARQHGVEVRPPDINLSDWDNTLEPIGAGSFAVRLGLRRVEGVKQQAALRLLDARDTPFSDIADLKVRARMDTGSLRLLAAADAFGSLGLDRRAALWDTAALRDAPDLPLFTAVEARDEGRELRVPLPVMPNCEQVAADYQTLRLSLKAHPLAFLRRSMAAQGLISTETLGRTTNGERVRLAGLVLVRQRPGSAKGVCFITVEDEHGVANLIAWPKIMETYRAAIMASRLIYIEGRVQRDADIIHIVAEHLENRSDALDRLADGRAAPPITTTEEALRPIPDHASRHPREVRVVPKSRDFR